MKVSRLWLQKFFDQPLPATATLADALTFHAFEIDSIERVASDEVLEVKVTPNRGHDCLSHRGIAKELSAILKIPLVHDPFEPTQKNSSKKSSDLLPPAGQIFSQNISASAISLSLDTPLCKRYIAAYIKGVKVAPSPKWLRERLEAIGQRSINNVVDATNFVMFNTGQPLHAFDASKLKTIDGKLDIGVRTAREGEEMTALDQKKYTLKSSMLVITSGGDAIGLAGVKGGLPAGITEATRDIVLESANFDGATTRKTAAALSLRTDASARYEQVISPELCRVGVQGFLEFVAHVTGGEVVDIVDVYPQKQTITSVSVSLEKINAVLGLQLSGKDVADVFSRLGFTHTEEDNTFTVMPPFERLDIEIPEDLVEEVGRIVGYEKVTTTPLPTFSHKPAINQNFYAADKVREGLVAEGYSEVYTSVFADTGERVILNKIDGVRPYLRESLLPGLTEALGRNKRNKELLGLKEVKLFEIGTVWKNGKEITMVGTATEKGNGKETPLEPIDSDSYEKLPLSSASRYESFSKYPYIVRDIALWVSEGTEPVEVEEIIKSQVGELCTQISLFDCFERGGKTSLAFRLIFQSFERTLTDEEVNGLMEKVSRALKEKDFEIR